MNKKGQVMQGISNLAVGIAVFAIVIVIAFVVIGQTKTNIVTENPCDDGYTINGTGCCLDASYTDGTCFGANQTADYNSQSYLSTQTLQTATATVPGWVGLIVLIAVGALILGMIQMFGRR